MLIVLIIIIVLIVVKFCWNYLRLCYYALKIPGPPAFPLVGNIFELLQEELITTAFKLHNKYGSFKVWIGPFPLIFIDDPDDVQTIFSNKYCIDSSWMIRYIIDDNNILPCSTGVKWRQKRKIVASGLTQLIVDSFLPTFNKINNILVEQLKAEVGKPEPFRIGRYVGYATFNSVFETVFNIEGDYHENLLKYLEADKSDWRIKAERFKKIWLHPYFIYKRSALWKDHKKSKKIKHDIATRVIKKWEEYKNDKSCAERKRKTMLDCFMELMETFPDITHKELIDEIAFLITAGYGTTAITLSFILIALGAHQDIQQKVYEELLNVFGNTNRSTTVDDLDKLQYLEMVIHETLRLFPTIPYLQRNATTDIQLKQFLLPRNSEFFISIFQLHRHPKYWKDPHKFDPNRFNPNNKNKQHPFAYMPFGVGPRKCPGQKFAMVSMKVALSKIIKNYKISTPLKLEELKLNFDITLKLIGGHLITITPRNISKNSITDTS